MDENNERIVWEMLMKTATNFSAQYLYFAPKFPRELEFNREMTVAFCLNGSLVKNSRNDVAFGMGSLISKVKRAKHAKKAKR